MAKPRKDAEAALLAAGRALLEESGVSALSCREAARRAKVNLGLFHYYFKTKDAFTRRLLDATYEAFFSDLGAQVRAAGGDPLEGLRRALIAIGRFGRDHRRLLMVLLEDGMRGGPQTIAFAAANLPRHVGVLTILLEECWRAGRLRRVPPPVAISFLLGGISAPNCVVSMLERAGAKRPFGASFAEFEVAMLSDETIELRVDLILRGLAPERKK